MQSEATRRRRERTLRLGEVLLGLDGFRVLDALGAPDELVIRVETTVTVAWCASCGGAYAARWHDQQPQPALS